LAIVQQTGGYDKTEGTTHLLSTLQSDGVALLDAGGSVRVSGTKVKIAGNLEAIGSRVDILAVQNAYNQDHKFDHESGGIFGSETNIRKQTSGTTTVKAPFEVGGNITLTARNGDVTLDAVKPQVGGNVTLNTINGKLNILGSVDTSYSQDFQRSEGALW
jgi:filamentous hemagglutinin